MLTSHGLKNYNLDRKKGLNCVCVILKYICICSSVYSLVLKKNKNKKKLYPLLSDNFDSLGGRCDR